MNDILKTYMERFRENRHTLRRYTAFVLALAMITTLFVNWQLHGVGISMTAQYQCGEEEHTHTADCYTKVLTCGYEEGELENADELAAAAATSQPTVEAEPAPLSLEPQIEFVPHEHTEDCYTEVQTLTCMEEEHVHGDDCFDPEDGSLICDKFEHTHDESCYTTEYELTCGLEEGELVEQVVEPTQSAELAAMAVAEPVALEPTVDTVEPIYHHHTDACYEEVLTCPLPEHHHTVACLSDTSADVETPEEWQAANAEAVMTGNWDEDLLSVAKTQLGYEQSEKNFEIDPADGVTLRYYSRYGQSYGNPYGEWDVMFLSYCLKYAGIPQSAIPQEASVLALRSSMSDMDWLLDGEDGSAANVGDIVIYNKYVTRTVAVDSSADGAADDLDDLFSMDTDFENGAELEASGAAALDTAPAAEDAPAADSVITPDLPDTANPEQPAAKPADSTGTSASGADTLIPSVVSPAAEPQTTTVTDAEPVETVGIVSEADENTLTVISGDVDGKVAEVTLSNAEVLGVVDVAAAQYADEMLTTAVTGALRAPGMLTLAGEGDTTASTPTTYLDYFVETRENHNGGITKYTYHVGEEEKTGDFTVTANQTLYFDFNYTIASGVLKEGHNTLTYKLPEAIRPKKETRTEIKTDDGKVVGEQVFKTDGTTVLTFDLKSEGFNPNEPFSGHFKYEWKYQKEDATKHQTITFPGSGTTITLEKLEDIDIKKSKPDVNAGTITETANGETKLHYTVTVSSNNGWSQKIHIWDGLKPDSNFTSADYDKTSFKLFKVKSNGDREEISITPDFTKKDKKYKNYNKTFQINDLPELEAGESYELTYDVLTTRTGSATLKNTAKTNDSKEASRDVTLDGNRLWKNGEYDKVNNCINWTVTVNNPSASDLNKYVVTDTLESGKIIGDVTLSVQQDSKGEWHNPNVKIATITDAKDQSSFTYDFSNLANKDDRSAKIYVFTYKSTVPEGSTSVKNKVEYGYKNKFTTEKDVSIPSSGSGSGSGSGSTEINPTKTASGTLTPSENPYLLTAPWTITAAIPGKGVYTFSDRITNSSGWFNGKEVIYHYGIANELQQQLVNNLTITYVENGETKILRCSDLSDLKNKGISFAVKYYQYEWSGSLIDASDNSTPVRAFEVTLDTTQCKLELKKLTLNYSTRVDGTNLPEGTRVTINNQINYNNSVKYEYQKPSSALKLTKGVRFTTSGNKKAEDHGKCYSPDASSGGTLTKDYAKFLEDGRMLEYQVLLDFSSVDTLPDTITLTDTLPKGLTYFTKDGDPSASIVFINGYDKDSKYKELPLKDSEELYSLKNYFRPAGRLVVTEPDEASEDGQTLKFNITGLEKIDFAKLKAQGYTELVLRYRAKLTDTRWSSLRFEEATYTNKVKWEERSDLHDEVNVYVKQTSEVLTKDSEQVDGQSRAKYTLIINPAAKDLHEGSNTITLRDVLTVKNEHVQASLDISSVHLYNTETNKEIPLTEYGYLPPKQTTGKNNYPVYTTTFTLPDETPLKLVYEYVTTANGAIKLENTAEVEGANRVTETTELESAGSESGVSQAPLTVYKVDKRNYSLYLTGAGFTLDYFDSTAGEWKPVNDHTEYKVSNKGTLTFHFAGKDALKENTLYKLTEVTAPEGYSEASHPYYFIYQGADASQEEAYNIAVGGHTSDIPAQTDENLLFCANNKSSRLFVPNTANSLTIIKNWKDKDGSFLAGDAVNMDEVDVQLYCYEKNADRTTAVKYGKVFQLTKKGNWTTTVDIDADHREGYIFYIEELNVNPSRFTVVYDQKDGVEVGGTLTFTNKDTGFADYELPSTGGTGTFPYTAVGGTMMLSALAYSFIHRKRRREGRADD